MAGNKTVGSIVRRSGSKGSFVYAPPPSRNQVGYIDSSGITTSRYPRRQLSGWVITRTQAQGNAGK